MLVSQFSATVTILVEASPVTVITSKLSSALEVIWLSGVADGVKLTTVDVREITSVSVTTGTVQIVDPPNVETTGGRSIKNPIAAEVDILD